MAVSRLALLALIFCLFSAYASKVSGQTVGHEILRLEFETGANEHDLEILDIWLSENIKESNLKPSTAKGGKQEALKNLTAVHRYLFEKNKVKYRPLLFFHEMLRSWSGDCDLLVFYYLSLAEKLNWPLYAVIAPRHLFIRWVGKDFTIDWDANTGYKQDVGKYFQNGFISPEAVANQVFLSPLSRSEVLSLIRFNMASWYAIEKNNHKRAAELASEAIGDSTRRAEIYEFRGECLEKLGRKEEAEQDFQKASALDPRLGEIHRAMWGNKNP
jgi:hypothetical protein